MRFRGGGVGHKSTQEACNFFKKDRDRLDVTDRNEQDDGLDEQEDSEMDLEEQHEVNDPGVDVDEEEEFGYLREESDDSEDEVAADGQLVRMETMILVQKMMELLIPT